MNTKVSVARSYKSKDNLIILADYDDFSWTSAFLSEAECRFLQSAARRELSDVLLPQAQRVIIVQFVKNG